MIIVSNRDAWESAVERAVVEFKYGDSIPRTWLEDAFGIKWPDTMTKAQAQRISLEFFSQMERFRETLLHKHKMALHTDGRGSWQIVPPGQQHLLAIETARRGVAKALAKASEIIEETRVEMLSVDEANARRAAQAKLANFEALTKKKLNDPPPTKALSQGSEVEN